LKTECRREAPPEEEEGQPQDPKPPEDPQPTQE